VSKEPSYVVTVDWDGKYVLNLCEEEKMSKPEVTVKKRIKMVRLREDVQFYGLNGSQVASTQSGITLEWVPETMVVIVKHSSFPGEERWLLPAGISFIAFEEVK